MGRWRERIGIRVVTCVGGEIEQSCLRGVNDERGHSGSVRGERTVGTVK